MDSFAKGLKVGQKAITSMVSTAFQKLGGFLPSLVGAILILIVGWLMAALFRGLSRRVFKVVGINYIVERSGVNNLLEKLGMQRKAEDILASLVYLIVLLVFVVASTEVLGIHIVIETLNRFISYLPRVFGALFVFVFLAYLGNFLKRGISSFLQSYHLAYAEIVGRIIEVLVLVFALIMALRELGFETAIFTANITLIIGIFLGAIGLALGLGTREVTRKVVSGIYLRKYISVGDEIQAGDVAGKVLSLENTSVTVETPDGIILIPNDQILESNVKIKKKENA